MSPQNKIPKQVQDDRYADILDYDWNYDSLPNRMPMSQRAKIFLPFAALTGFNEALDDTLKAEIEKYENGDKI
jgi:hypothetical protein